ncbi:complex I subunit 1 family protein [Paracoccus jeotgali]|uniref:complex I subunit 1 family protein n=1 Tax=Paracoccus jeotgali TaxID=2065379 RepID=UPI0028B1D05A|nr:complex I subunit 1 family protein [Paracoccus jeotgali]
MTALLILSLPLTLALGAWLAASLDRLVPALWGLPAAGPLTPLREAAALLAQQTIRTERPDRLTLLLAPALYLTLAAVGLSVVPLWLGVAPIESPVGIVIWGSCEALTIITVFLHGWSPNAPFPLIGAYRYVAIALPVMLPSMFVLIAAALPAESLSVTAIVASQEPLWNVLRQPMGLPLFLLVGLTLTLRGPFDYADGADIAGGTSAEDSGAGRALWQFARLSMLVAFSAMAAAVFLGGPLGPWLPGPVWLWLKTAAVMALTVLLGHAVARTTPSRMLGLLWVVALPLSFLHLAIAGVLAL